MVTIYKASEKAILETFESHGRDQNLTFHLSPGTWAMSSVWYILSETKYPARLIQSSPEAGVQDVNIPFEISAERLSANQLAQNQNMTRIATAFTGSDGEVISRSSTMRRLFSKISKANKYSFPVLIESEQGCDQGHLAKTLHETGSRSQDKFHHIDWKEIELEDKFEIAKIRATAALEQYDVEVAKEALSMAQYELLLEGALEMWKLIVVDLRKTCVDIRELTADDTARNNLKTAHDQFFNDNIPKIEQIQAKKPLPVQNNPHPPPGGNGVPRAPGVAAGAAGGGAGGWSGLYRLLYFPNSR